MSVRKLGNAAALVDIQTIGRRAFVGTVARTIAAAALVALLSTACQERRAPSAELDKSFDEPIRKEVIDLGASPYYPAGQEGPPTALSCFYFPDFMVKEHYLGGKGAEWLSILPNPGEPPECKTSHERGERVIEYPEWEGYFAGAKGNLVFFEAADSFNGGTPFAIFDVSTGTKIFEDSALFESAPSSSDVKVVSTREGYVLEYLRVVDGGCDLYSDGAACWNKVKAELSLQSDDVPLCTGYEHLFDLFETDHADSMIAYAVEVTLSPLPNVRSAAGPLRCWPAL